MLPVGQAALAGKAAQLQKNCHINSLVDWALDFYIMFQLYLYLRNGFSLIWKDFSCLIFDLPSGIDIITLMANICQK